MHRTVTEAIFRERERESALSGVGRRNAVREVARIGEDDDEVETRQAGTYGSREGQNGNYRKTFVFLFGK